MNTERDRLKAELAAQASRETAPERKDGSEIDQAIEALRTLGEALRKAEPEDTKQLLSTIVVKIELYFNHSETEAGRKTSEFSHGFIHVRPDAGAGSLSDPDSTQLTNKRSFFGVSHAPRVLGHRPPTSLSRPAGLRTAFDGQQATKA
jgi:hypothetical protein